MPNRRNNWAESILTLTGQGAGTVTSADQENLHGWGLHVIIDVTAISGTSPTLTVTLRGKDTVSGKYYTLLASAAISAVSTTVLRVFPGAVASANAAANDILPENWDITAVVGGTGPSVTATIGVQVVAGND